MIDNTKLYIFKNFLSSEECDEYYKKIYDIGPQPKMLDFKIITADLTGDPIGEKVKNFLNKKFLINLDLDQLQIQNWHVNSFGNLHTHYNPGREHIIYTSSLYLNDDFLGGEFITEDGKKFKPIKGALTFFNGQKIKHGVNPVFKTDRKSLIFWWRGQ